MSDPLVSVVVPVYDGEDFLAECLDGLAAQTHPAVEVIVVDDGSTDGTAAIARDRPGVTYLHQENAGQVVARRHGLARAHGDYVAFHDHDDVMGPDRLARQVAYLEAHPETTAVLCRHEVLLSDGLTEVPDWVPRDTVYGDLSGVEWTSMLCRRDALRPEFFASTAGTADGIHILAGLRDDGHRIDVLDEKLWLRRFHGDNLTADRDALRHETLRYLRERARGR